MARKISIFISCFLFISFASFGNKITDSLRHVLKNKKLTEKQKCLVYGDLAWEFTNINVDSAKYFAQKAMVLAQKIKDTGRYCDALNTLGIISQYQSDYRSALEYYHKALKEFSKIKDTAWMASLYNNIAIVYQYQHNYTLALQYTLKGLKTYQLTDDSLGVANSYANIGLTYAYMKDYDNANRYYDTTLALHLRMDNKNGVANTYLNWGSIYADRNDYVGAEDLFRKALEYADTIDYPHAYYVALANLGLMRGNLGNTNEALTLCQESMKYAEKFQITEILITNCQCLYNAYKVKKEFALANEYLEKLMALKDSSNNQQLTAELSMKDADLKYSLKYTQDSLLMAKEKELSVAENKAKLEKKQFQQYVLYTGLFIAAIFGIFMYNRFRVTRRQKNIIELKEKETFLQKQIIQEKNKEIIDSINYAQRLQQAILTPESEIRKYFKDSFLLYKPKDIVAGDFYFFEVTENHIFYAAADCTGHGVPGAMMSIVCSNALTKCVKEFQLTDPGQILDKTRELIVETFQKSGQDVKDGMDISLLAVESKRNFASGIQSVKWAGANNALWYIENGRMCEIRPDKQPIGKMENPQSFTTHALPPTSSSYFLFTDGYADQFGGEKGKKFKNSNLQKLLLEISNLELKEQSQILNSKFNQWKGDLEQVDDVCIIGVRL